MNVISFFPPFNQSLYHKFYSFFFSVFLPCVSTSPFQLWLSFSPINVALFPEWMVVFAEKCSGLLPGQRAMVSPRPADLSPRHCLHVTPGPLTFPSCCSSRVSVPKFLLQLSLVPFPWGSHFSIQPFLRTWYTSCTCHSTSLLRAGSKTWKHAIPSGPMSWNAMHTTYVHLKKLQSIHLQSLLLHLFFLNILEQLWSINHACMPSAI